jgi:hypothetical protein
MLPLEHHQFIRYCRKNVAAIRYLRLDKGRFFVRVVLKTAVVLCNGSLAIVMRTTCRVSAAPATLTNGLQQLKIAIESLSSLT